MSQSTSAEGHHSNSATQHDAQASSQHSSSQVHDQQSNALHSQEQQQQHNQTENEATTSHVSRRKSHSPNRQEAQEETTQSNSATPSRFNFSDGCGVKLGELPCFSQAPKRGKGAAALELALEPLHSLIYNRRGKTGERRAALHDFAGFPASMENEIKEKLNRLDKKKLHTLIKSIGINVKTSANRAILVDELAKFVMSPNAEKLINPKSNKGNKTDASKSVKRSRSSAASQRKRSSSPSKRGRSSNSTRSRTTTSSTHGKRNRTNARSPSHSSSRGRSSSPHSRKSSTSPKGGHRRSKRLRHDETISDEAIKAAIYEHVLLLPCDERKELGAKSLRLYLEQHFNLPDGSLKTRKELIATTASNGVKALVEAEKAAIAAAATGDINKVLLHTPFEPEGDSQSGVNVSPTPLAEQVVDELKEKAAFFTDEKAVMQAEAQARDNVKSNSRGGSTKRNGNDSLKTTRKKLPGESNLPRDAINLPTTVHDAQMAQFQAAKEEFHASPEEDHHKSSEHAKSQTPGRGDSVHEAYLETNLLQANNFNVNNVENNYNNFDNKKNNFESENFNNNISNNSTNDFTLQSSTRVKTNHTNNYPEHLYLSEQQQHQQQQQKLTDDVNEVSTNNSHTSINADTTTVAHAANMANTEDQEATFVDTTATSEV